MSRRSSVVLILVYESGRIAIRIGTNPVQPAARFDFYSKNSLLCTFLRECGILIITLQVYHVDCGKYFYMNNTDGRKLSEQGFEESLRMFFDNGETFCCELICCFIRKLKAVLNVMEKDLCSYRFYNSSLLLVYEGEVAGYSQKGKTDCFCASF